MKTYTRAYDVGYILKILEDAYCKNLIVGLNVIVFFIIIIFILSSDISTDVSVYYNSCSRGGSSY